MKPGLSEMFLLDWTKFSARQQECEGDVLHHVARGNVKHSAGLIQYFKIDISSSPLNG